MNESTVTETEEQKKAREARAAEAANNAKFSYEDAKGFFGTLGEITSTIFNWGIPALIFGGLILALAKPISELVRSTAGPEWADKFLGYTEMAKQWINEKTGKDIFHPIDESLIDTVKRQHVADSPDLLRNAMTPTMGADIAKAIVPDKQASAELVNNFLPSQNLTISQLEANPALFMQPQVLGAFVRRYPQTMQRVAEALPQGGTGQIPEALKAPLKTMLGNPQNLTALMSDPQHAQWITTAVTRLGGAQAAKAFTAMQGNPPQLAGVINDMIDGMSPAQVMERAKQHGPLPAEFKDMAYETAKAHQVYGPLIAAIEAKDESFATELKAVLERTTDEKQIGEQVLAMVTGKPARIAALKDLSAEQLAPILDAFGVKREGDTALFFADKATRDAAIDMIAGLAASNTPGRNELAGLIGAVSKSDIDEMTRAATIAQYIQGNPARIQAVETFAARLEQIGGTRGNIAAEGNQPEINVRELYASNAKTLHALAAAPERVVELAKVHAALPPNLQPITQGMLQYGPNFMGELIANDELRGVLDGDTNGRKNLYIVGDALRVADVKQLGVDAGMMGILLTPAANGSYPNLDTLVTSLAAIDNATGVDIATSKQLLNEKRVRDTDANATDAQRKETNDKLAPEILADRENLRMAAFMMGIRGATLESGTGETAVYRVETPFGTITNTPAQIAAHFQANDSMLQQMGALTGSIAGLDDATKQAIAGLGDDWWKDANNNGRIDAKEGAAAVLKNPEDLAMMMMSISNPQSEQLLGTLSIISNVVKSLVTSDDLKKMEAIAARFQNTGIVTDGQNVAAVNAPTDQTRLTNQSGMGAAKFV